MANAAAQLIGCSDGGETQQGTSAEAEPCLPPDRLVGDSCLLPGVADDGCPAGTLGLDDGSCQPAGILPEMCGEGFVDYQI